LPISRRSISGLNPVAAGVPRPASARGVSESSLKKVTRGESAATMCSASWPSLNPRAPSDLLCAETLMSANPEK
jgi:hypothetical protein